MAPSSVARSQAASTWPWISLSPTTIESRLEATRNSWAAARSSRSTYRAQASSSGEMRVWATIASVTASSASPTSGTAA